MCRVLASTYYLLSSSLPHQKAFLVLEGLLKEDDEVVQVWYLMGWMHYLTKDKDSSRFYLEQAKQVGHLSILWWAMSRCFQGDGSEQRQAYDELEGQ